jgi:2-oxo-3-hexenedioate decarboxylase
MASPAAAEILRAYDEVRPVDRSVSTPPDALAAAEALQAEVNAMRRARGERPVGYKIGFTNRSIWPIYGVHHPIWAPVWDTTVEQLPGRAASVRAGRFVEPRLEPEIVFGLSGAPASADPRAVLAAIEWVAHGFEIVQSHYPGWVFTAAETFATQGLHGRLCIGPRCPVSILGDGSVLERFEIDLACDGRHVARGAGALVLDSPLRALCHLVSELSLRGASLAPGDVVTTGTLTDAQPLKPGQRWTTTLIGLDLPGLDLEVAGDAPPAR